MATELRQPGLFEAVSSTAVTPLSPAHRQRLSGPAVVHTTIAGEGIDPAISQAIAMLSGEVEPYPRDHRDSSPQPLAPTPVGKSSPLTSPPAGQRPWWLWGLGAGMGLSLAANVLCAVALHRAQLPPRPSPAIVESSLDAAATKAGNTESAAEPLADSSCVRNSTQTITGLQRDRLLLSAITEHESGRRPEALQLFRRYVSEACDAATLQTIAILEREPVQPNKELAKSP